MNTSEIRETRKIARLCIHVEHARAIGHLKNFRMLAQIIKAVANQMLVVGAALCNMLPPLVRK